MANDVGNILSSVQRAQVFESQKTARQLDVASARLASGQKVSSALDNPNSYFLARALRNKAADLTQLLDGIGQNIKVIQEADHGIQASLKLLDLAESYLLDVQKKFLAGEVLVNTGLAPNETGVTFASPADLITYVPAQDFPASGTVALNSPTEFQLDGNFWKRKAFNYTVTAQTFLVFDYKSVLEPDFSTIGFDNDTNFGNDNDRFYLYGTQSSGLSYSAPQATYAYSDLGNWQHYEIPVGTYFTGNFNYLAFIHDDDSLPYGNASFKDIILREGPKQSNLNGSEFEAGYAQIINQLDEIAQDAHYRGINLLKGDTMTTAFNEDRSSKLVTKGIDATFAGLGLQEKGFNTLADVEEKIDQVHAAREKLRSYSSTLSNDLNVIQIRDEFTRDTVSIHRAGADKLTNADLNEEGALYLALQTRQQIQMSVLAFRPANILSILA